MAIWGWSCRCYPTEGPAKVYWQSGAGAGQLGTGDQHVIGDEAFKADSDDLIIEALMSIPNDAKFDDRAAWVRVAHAMKAAVSDSEAGFAAFSEWSGAVAGSSGLRVKSLMRRLSVEGWGG